MKNILSFVPLSMSALIIITNLVAMVGLLSALFGLFGIIKHPFIKELSHVMLVLFLFSRLIYKEKEVKMLTQNPE